MDYAITPRLVGWCPGYGGLMMLGTVKCTRMLDVDCLRQIAAIPSSERD